MDAVGAGVKDFSAEILGQRVHFHVIKLQKSFFLWVGRQPSLKSLAVAVQTRFDDQPISTHLLGEATDATSSSMAKKLAKKTNCQCFVSMNITDTSIHLAIEKHLLKLLEEDPSQFYF